MDLHCQIEVDAPADRVWEVLGARFAHVGEWAAPIESSCHVGEVASPGVGSSRHCTTRRFGPFAAGAVEERLVRFDAGARTLTYEAVRGLPRFVRRAVNCWTVTPLGPHRSLVVSTAVLELGGPVGLLRCPLAWQLERSGARVAQELKYFVERGVPHPRKLDAARAPRPAAAPH